MFGRCHVVQFYKPILILEVGKLYRQVSYQAGKLSSIHSLELVTLMNGSMITYLPEDLTYLV